MGLKEKIIKLAEDIKVNKERYDNIQNEKIEDITSIISDNAILPGKASLIANSIVDAISDDKIKDLISQFPLQDGVEQTFNDITKEGYEKAIDELKIKGVEIPSTIGMSLDQIKDITKDIFSNEDNKKLLDEKIASQTRYKLIWLVKQDIVKGFEILEPMLDSQKLDEIERTAVEYNPSNIENRKYKVLEEQKINDLIANAKSQQEMDALNFVKDNILISREAADQEYDKVMGEKINPARNKIIKAQILQNQREGHIYNEVITSDSLILFGRADGIKNVDKSKLDKEVSENGFIISDDTKTKLKEGLKLLEGMKDYRDGKPLLNIDSFRPEEPSKVYAFKNIFNLSGDITNAVKEGNTEKLVELTEKYKKADKEMTKLMDIFKSIDTPYMPGNVSLARNNGMPVKYSQNIREVSFVNGLWQTLGMLKTTGISIDEFVENPTKAYADFTNNPNAIKQEFSSIPYQNSSEFLNDMISGSTAKRVKSNLNILRSFEFIATLGKDNGAHNFEAYQVMQNAYMSEFIDNKKDEIDSLAKVTTDKVKSLIVSETKDNNYIEAFTDTKSYDSKIKELEGKQILDKLNKFKDIDNKIVKEAVKEVAQDLIKEKGANLKEFNELCKLSGKMGYKAFKESIGTNDIALSIKDDYSKISKNGISNDNMPKALNYLKIVDEQYNKRNWFGKHLRAEGRAEKKLLDQIKVDMDKSGLKADEIKGFLNGDKKVSDFVKEEKPVNVDNPFRIRITIDLNLGKDDKVKQNAKEFLNVKNKDKEIQSTKEDVTIQSM